MTKDIFVIPIKNNEGEYIIYAPLQNVAFIGNKKAADIIDRYVHGGEISNEEKNSVVWNYITQIENVQITLPKSKIVGSASNVVIILSQLCNLACTYCYAQEAHSNKILSKNKLKTVIDYILSNSASVVNFVFIGGGEPLLTWGLLKWAINYIYENKKSSQINITITTNATLLTSEKINYLKKYNVHLGISFDILPEIQNTQRPFVNTKLDSFEVVNDVIKKIEDAEISCSFRSTITKLNVKLMPDMVCFVKANYKGVKKLHFEPVANLEENDEEFYDEFVKSFMKAREIGSKNGITVYNSISNSLDKLSSRFCRGEFCITPTGDIVACHRISSRNEFAFKFVNYGIVNEEVNINLSNRSKVYETFNTKYKNCNTCYAKWHCAGGCPIERLFMQSPVQQRNKCLFTKSLIKHLLEERVAI